ncbi:MAG: hypothetical protein LAO05_11545 [Acidobacteriia bacterium]|nr:hypothetical protein [Terriglobia bacterium]
MISWRRVVPIATVVIASLLTAPIASAQTGSLTTGFEDWSGWCSGLYVDLTASVPLTVTSFDVYFKGTLNRNVSVYYKAGTYVGSETTPGAWTLLGTVNVSPGGTGTATAVNLGGVAIPAGQTYAFYFVDLLGTGGPDGGGLNLDLTPSPVSNADLTLNSSMRTCDTPFTDPEGGMGWEGTVYYQLGGQAIPVLGTTALAGLATLVLFLGWFVLRQRSAT